MREQERKEFLTMFFGRVVSREVVGFADPGKEKPRPRLWSAAKKPEKAVASVVIASQPPVLSPHVVDLSSFSSRWDEPPRADLDFEQKLNVFAQSVRSAVSSAPSPEHRTLIPHRPKRKHAHAPLSGFFKLPFALIALPFRQVERAAPRETSAPAVPKESIAFRPAEIVLPETRVVAAKTESRPIAAFSTSAAATLRIPWPVQDARPPQAVVTKTKTAPVVIRTMPRPSGPLFSYLPQPDARRRILGFAAVALAVSLPFQLMLSYTGLLQKAAAIAVGAKEAAFGLRDAGESALKLDSSSQASFDRAAGGFAATRDRVDDLSLQVAALLTGNRKRLAAGSHLLTAGEDVSRAGASIAAGLDDLRVSQGTVAEKLARMSAALSQALPSLEAATKEFDRVSPSSLPVAAREPFIKIRESAAGAVDDLKRASVSSPILLDAIGASGKRRYLVVFENSDELRPTGGFIGSYALIDLEDGAIKKIEVPAGGSYDLQGSLNQRVAAPKQLTLVNPRWEFQDANWFADFPTSAKSLVWFYEKSGGPSVDGVIAVTSNVMQDLLRQVGPIAMPEYGKTLTADNFQSETQKAVQFEYDPAENRPKQIISDMLPKVLQKLIDGGSSDVAALAATLGKDLASKDVQIYFSDEKAQAAADSFGWTGALRPLPGADFLAVNDANIAGGKTDGVVSEDVSHEMSVEADGSIVDTVEVTRAHHGKEGDLFTGIKNIDYMRLYVPRGSELISAEGFNAPGDGYFQAQDDTLHPSALLSAVEGQVQDDKASGTRVTEESGLTVFGNWVQVAPGETRTVKVSYRLPFRLQDVTAKPVTSLDHVRQVLGAWTDSATLKLVVRKQPGAADRTFSSRVRVPDGWKIRSSVPEQASAGPDGLTLSGPFDKDLYEGLLLTRPK